MCLHIFLLQGLLAVALAHSETPGAPKAPNLSPWAADDQTMFLFEMAVAALTVAFLVIFALGSWSNLVLAREVAAKLEQCLSLQFSQLGTGDGNKLVKDGQSYFWFYATGRRYTSGIMALIDLAKRMDIFSYSSSFFSTPHKDRVVFYLPLTAEVDMEPMSLFLVKKKELARLKQVNEGEAVDALELYADMALPVNGLPEDFIAMTEHRDIVTALLPDNIRTIILENAKFVNSIHVTESGAKWDSQSRASRQLVRVDFNLPLKRTLLPDVVEGMVKVAMHLVDAAAETKLTSAAKKRALNMRIMAVQAEERLLQKKRAEEAAERKLEKKKEEEEAVGRMSRDKQAKYEERKRKKELNARMRKVVRK